MTKIAKKSDREQNITRDFGTALAGVYAGISDMASGRTSTMPTENAATTFAELDFIIRRDAFGGKRAITAYPNGYGASIVIGPNSYGGESGKYEVAVTKGGELCYTTPLTDDVVGHLSEEGVTELLTAIAALPTAQS